MIDWIDTKVFQPPTDKPFWAWLHQSGIRKMKWYSAEEVAEQYGWDAEECEGRYAEFDEPKNEWEPDFWLPIDAIPSPVR